MTLAGVPGLGVQLRGPDVRGHLPELDRGGVHRGGRGHHVLHAAAHEPGGQAALAGQRGRQRGLRRAGVGERDAGPGGAHLQRGPAAGGPGGRATPTPPPTSRSGPGCWARPCRRSTPDISIGLVILGMAAVYATGGRNVTTLGPVVVLLIRGAVLQPAAPGQLPLAGRGRALPRGAPATPGRLPRLGRAGRRPPDRPHRQAGLRRRLVLVRAERAGAAGRLLRGGAGRGHRHRGTVGQRQVHPGPAAAAAAPPRRRAPAGRRRSTPTR